MNRHFTEEDTHGKEAHDFKYIIHKSICVLLCCAQSLSHVLLFVTLWTVASQAPLSMGIVQARILECHALLEGIFPTQGSNPSLPHCRWILYHLSHQGSPRILEWVAYPSLRETFQPRELIQVYRMQADSLPVVLPGKPLVHGTSVSFLVLVSNYSFILRNLQGNLGEECMRHRSIVFVTSWEVITISELKVFPKLSYPVSIIKMESYLF